MEDIINAGKTWLSHGNDSTVSKYTEEYFAGEFVELGQVLVTIGVVTLLIVGVIMAIKWIVAKPDQMAKLKEQLIGLVVAAIVIFGAIGIWNLVRTVMNNVEGTITADNNSISTTILAENDKTIR